MFEWQVLYRLRCLPSPLRVFYFHGISDIGFLSFNFKSPSEGNKFSRLNHAPRSLCVSRSGGHMLTREAHFLLVLLALMNPCHSGFQIQVCSGQVQSLRKFRWVKLVSRYKNSMFCFLRMGHACAAAGTFDTALTPGAP